MKFSAMLFSFVFSASALAQGLVPPHLDLEMTSEEYQQILAESSAEKSFNEQSDDPQITAALKIGSRLSQWIALINTGRTPTTAIRLTSPLTRRGIPIDKPNTYSPDIIGADTIKVMGEVPAEMKAVVTSEGDLPVTTSLSDETFIKYGRQLDRIYQSAARYKALDGYRYYYIQAASRDVRGHYFLTKNNYNEVTLRDVALIPADQQAAVRDALIKICTNSSGSCEAKVAAAFANNTLSKIYSTYYPASKVLWDEFFKIPVFGKRSDVTWVNNTLTVPFNTPSIPKFVAYIQDNVQDEFRFNDWKLLLNFGVFSNGPRVIFEAGVVPHVNGLGGNEITMDSNQPIEEYESQWTIRHEFGHVIGLPDCYHEFYDVNLKAYVNYQLDTTDLMCSRAGNMTERIFNELKGAYEK